MQNNLYLSPPPSPGREIMVSPKQLIFCALKARCTL